MSKRRSKIERQIYWCEGNYWANNFGNIWNANTGYELKPHCNNGYLYVALKRKGQNKFTAQPVHRIVCRLFHGEPPTEGCQVNHKDGNKSNNCAWNLEWLTQKENIYHAWETGLAPRIADFNEPRKCPVMGIDRYGTVLCCFPSIKEAQRCGHREWCIHLCLKNPNKIHHGMYWRKVVGSKIIL